MSIIFLLIAASTVVAVIFLAAFVLAPKHGYLAARRRARENLGR